MTVLYGLIFHSPQEQEMNYFSHLAHFRPGWWPPAYRPNWVCHCLFLLTLEWSLFIQPFITATETGPSSLSGNLDHTDQSHRKQALFFFFFRHVCYYFGGGWHTQVITSEPWWLSLFGADSRLIGPISSWVDVPGARHNLIRQRRVAAAGLCWEKKKVPSSMLSWPEAKSLCQLGTVRLDSSLCVWCTCACMHSREC